MTTLETYKTTTMKKAVGKYYMDMQEAIENCKPNATNNTPNQSN
jgi:hypothetical protein